MIASPVTVCAETETIATAFSRFRNAACQKAWRCTGSICSSSVTHGLYRLASQLNHASRTDESARSALKLAKPERKEKDSTNDLYFVPFGSQSILEGGDRRSEV